MASVHVFQIFYSEATRRALDPGFLPLDNSGNERPDWREYWPIRRFLLGTPLVEGDYYGFLSPRFAEKTQIGSAQMIEFARTAHAQCDVVSFSPHPDQHGLFWNVFEHGDWWHPGMLAAAQGIFDHLALGVRLDALVMDSRTSIFSNYFVAKPTFWRPWLALNERLFALAESREGPLAARLNAPMSHRVALGAVDLKVFVMERTASLVLAMHPELKATAYKPFTRPLSVAFGRFGREAVLSDALKIAFNTTGDPIYKGAFGHLRAQVKQQLGARPGS